MRFVAVLAAVLCLGSAARAGYVYDALTDFPLANTPNVPWEFGWSPTLGGAMTVYPNYAVESTHYQTWRDDSNASLGTPSVWRRSDEDLLYFHPGPNDYSIIRWTAPVDGTVDWDASFLSTDQGWKRVAVHHNSTELYSAVIHSSLSAAAPGGILSVTAGDHVYVSVHNYDGYFYDAARVSFRLELGEPESVPEPASLGLIGLGGLLMLRRRR